MSSAPPMSKFQSVSPSEVSIKNENNNYYEASLIDSDFHKLHPNQLVDIRADDTGLWALAKIIDRIDGMDVIQIQYEDKQYDKLYTKQDKFIAFIDLYNKIAKPNTLSNAKKSPNKLLNEKYVDVYPFIYHDTQIHKGWIKGEVLDCYGNQILVQFPYRDRLCKLFVHVDNKNEVKQCEKLQTVDFDLNIWEKSVKDPVPGWRYDFRILVDGKGCQYVCGQLINTNETNYEIQFELFNNNKNYNVIPKHKIKVYPYLQITTRGGHRFYYSRPGDIVIVSHQQDKLYYGEITNINFSTGIIQTKLLYNNNVYVQHHIDDKYNVFPTRIEGDIVRLITNENPTNIHTNDEYKITHYDTSTKKIKIVHIINKFLENNVYDKKFDNLLNETEVVELKDVIVAAAAF